MSYSRSLGKIFSFQVITLLLNLVLGVFTTRILNPEGRGTIALILVFVSVVEMAFRGGVDLACMNYLHKEGIDKPRWIHNTLTFALTLSFSATLLSFIFYKPLAKAFFENLPIGLFILAAPRILLMMLCTYMRSIFLAENQFDASNALDVLVPICNIVVVAALLVLRQVNVETILLSGTVALAIPAIWGWFALNRIYPFRLRFDLQIWKQLFSYGYKSHLSSLTDFFNARLDLLLVSHYLGIASVGIYSLAQMSERLQLIPNAFGQTILAKMSKDRENYRKKSGIVCRNTLAITGIAVLVTTLGAYFIPTLYGKKFAPAVTPFIILTIGTLFVAITKTIKSYIYIYMEKPQISTYASIGNLLINLVLNLWLIPSYGIIGAAIAASGGYFVYAVMHLVPFLRHSGESLWETLIIQKGDFAFYKKFLFKQK